MKDVPEAASGGLPPKRARGPRWLDNGEPKSTRTALTRRRIVDAAIAVVSEHGLPALTMRRLAAALETAPMSLYSHVADKAELIDLMVDDVLGEVVEQLDGSGGWQQQLRHLGRTFYTAWAKHPGLIVVYSTGVTLGPNSVTVTEWLVKILRDAGLPDRDAAYSLYALTQYVIGTLQFSPIRTTPGAEPAEDGRFHDRISEYFTAVPVESIPNMVAVDEHLNGDAFEFGLDLMIAGLETRVALTRAG